MEYVSSVIEKYQKEKDKIFDYMLQIRLREFYSSVYNYSDEYIRNNIGRPRISIISRKDDAHPNWKFNYFGVLEFCESKLDEHIISIEFIDDFNLSKDVQMDG